MRIILASIAFAFTATSAYAADAIVADEVIVVPNTFSWTGGYIGINGGYAIGKGKAQNVYQPQLFDYGERFNSKFNLDGYLGGIQAGYNYQFENKIVIGGEADFQWLDFDGSYNTGLEDKVSAKLKWLSTIRARLGYAHDRTLFYATGGVAIGKLEITAFEYANDANFTGSKQHVGYTVGAGVEHAITDHLTAKLEYNFVDLAKKDYKMSDTGPYNYSAASAKGSGYGSLFRVGLNYKF